MNNDHSNDACVDERALLSLVDKLEAFAEAMSPDERQFIRNLIDQSIDPIERLRKQAGDSLLDPVELALLDELETE